MKGEDTIVLRISQKRGLKLPAILSYKGGTASESIRARGPDPIF